MNSLQKFIGSSVKLGLVQAGIPYLMNKVEETKIQTEHKAKTFVIKAVIGIFALIFFLIALIFLFGSLFFYLAGNPVEGTAALITGGISLILSIFIGLITLLIK